MDQEVEMTSEKIRPAQPSAMQVFAAIGFMVTVVITVVAAGLILRGWLGPPSRPTVAETNAKIAACHARGGSASLNSDDEFATCWLSAPTPATVAASKK